MVRTAIFALGLAGVGLFTAAPAMAQGGPSSTVSCSPCVLWEDTMENVAALPGQAVEPWLLLPGQTVARLAEVPSFPQQTIDNFRNLPGQAAARLAEVPSFPQRTMDNIRNLPQQAKDNLSDVTGGGG